MSLRELKWVTVVGPLVFLAVVDVVRHTIDPDLLHAWPGTILIGGVVLFATLWFSETVFGRIERMQTRLAHQNRELLTLHEAGLGIGGELSLEVVLQKVVEHAAQLIGARYGALSLPAAAGGIEAFITTGITAEERERTGPLPVGHGLLSVVLDQGKPLRLPDLTRDPRSVGFPEHHPPMRSLLAVPIVSGGRILGNLYLTEKLAEADFSKDDEDTLARFATQAALAIQNARLHRRVRDLAITEERERIAREMHDSLAQVLGYVITKAQAVQELLRRDQVDRAQAQLEQLGQAAQSAYADVREGILGLRTSLGPQRGLLEALQDYLHQWREQSGIDAELIVEPPDARLVGLAPAAELQLLRIVQEALTNVRKHAAAGHVRVRIQESPEAIDTQVEDDGRGFELRNGRARSEEAGGPHFGLATMQERVESVGGQLEVESAPGAGTRVLVRIPAPRAAARAS